MCEFTKDSTFPPADSNASNAETSSRLFSEPNQPTKVFATADLGQAAYLIALGHEFLGAEATERDRIVFKFADRESCPANEAARQFANNRPAPGKALIEAMRFLKSILRDVRPTTKVKRGEIMFNEQNRSPLGNNGR